MLIFIFLLIKNAVFEKIAYNKLKNIDKNYSCQIETKDINLKGLRKIAIHDLKINNETVNLLQIGYLEVKISPLKLLLGKIKIKSVIVSKFYLNLYKDSSKCSYNIVSSLHSADTLIIKTTSTDYYKRSTGIFRLIEGLIPSQMSINDLKVRIHYYGSDFNLSCEETKMKHNEFSSVFNVWDNVRKGSYRIDYQYIPSEHQLTANTTLLKGDMIALPIVSKKYNLYLTGKTIRFMLKMDNTSAKTASFSGELDFRETNIYHYRISDDTIKINRLHTRFDLNTWKTAFELDSTSFIKLNDFYFHPYLKYDRSSGQYVLLDFHTPRFDAQKLIMSVPKGIFTNLEGMKASGKLEYRIRIETNLKMPDSLKFYSRLKRYDFRVKSFGNLDYQRLLGEFEYTAYKNGSPVRSFMVGPSNASFVPIENIPEYLKQAVIFSEDGAYYYHRGFIEEAIKGAIITNIKRKRFARGGSTISMQFVKNVFLSSKKVMTRKIEEIIITWLIENYRLLSKDRLFEIYLNIIEWGPKLYGVGEACDFYFAKPLNRLTLAECIFMAAIIPRPASFYYAFDAQGHLKKHFSWHYKSVSGRMLKRNIITQEDYDNLIPDVQLTGPAAEFIKPDTLIINDTFNLDIPE